MMLKINKDECTGCGLCVKVCPFDAMHLVNEKAEDDEKCTLCGACVKVCPVDAITIERKRVDPSKFKDFKGVWVWAEQIDGQLRNVGLELLGKGRELADKLGLSAVTIKSGKFKDTGNPYRKANPQELKLLQEILAVRTLVYGMLDVATQ